MLITRILKSGGGPNAQYPKWVWSYYGGWYAAPENYIRNTIITGSLIATLASIGFYYSSQIETRHSYPHFWIPSMLWSRDFHDQEFVKVWKDKLQQDGREWIEPRWWSRK